VGGWARVDVSSSPPPNPPGFDIFFIFGGGGGGGGGGAEGRCLFFTHTHHPSFHILLISTLNFSLMIHLFLD
jgi:hypothetical protein